MAKQPKQAPNNPFACESNAVKMHTVGACCGTLLAAYSYDVTNDGNQITFTGLTGVGNPALKSYRWNIYDKFGAVVGGAVDLNNPTAPVIVNTSSLSKSGPFKVKFYASAGDGEETKEISYDLIINDPTSNPSGTSTPSNYENVVHLLELVSTDDANFSLFPAAGLEIYAGDVIDLVSYLSAGSNLGNLKNYEFKLSSKKAWYSPSEEQLIVPTGDVIDSVTPEAAYPIVLTNEYQQVLSGIKIATAVNGTFSETVTADLNNEDVQPSVSFTFKTVIG